MSWDLIQKIKELRTKSKEKKTKNHCIQYVGGKFINICDKDKFDVDNTKNIEEILESKNIEEVVEEDPIKILDKEELEGKVVFEMQERQIEVTGKRRPISQLKDEFERAIKLNHSKNTAISYFSAMKFWEGFSKRKGKSIYRLSARDMEEALEKYANKTRIQRMASLRKLAKIYLRNEYPALSLQTSMVMISAKKETHIVQYLDEESYIKLKDEIIGGLKRQEREYLWLGLFLFCGLRISEIQTIIIENEKFIKVLGKGDKERLVPCPIILIESIRNFTKEGYGGWKKSGKAIDSQLRRKGYLDKFHCHQLRHTFATGLYRKGVQLNTIKEVMGHNTIMTTQVYAKAKVDEGLLDYIDI